MEDAIARGNYQPPELYGPPVMDMVPSALREISRQPDVPGEAMRELLESFAPRSPEIGRLEATLLFHYRFVFTDEEWMRYFMIETFLVEDAAPLFISTSGFMFQPNNTRALAHAVYQNMLDIPSGASPAEVPVMYLVRITSSVS